MVLCLYLLMAIGTPIITGSWRTGIGSFLEYSLTVGLTAIGLYGFVLLVNMVILRIYMRGWKLLCPLVIISICPKI